MSRKSYSGGPKVPSGKVAGSNPVSSGPSIGSKAPATVPQQSQGFQFRRTQATPNRGGHRIGKR